MKIKKAVIPCGGLGTRFLPASKAVAKEMFPILDKPTLQILIENLVKAGIEEICIVLSRGKDIILNHFDRNPELESRLKLTGKLDLLKKSINPCNLCELTYIRAQKPIGLSAAVYEAKDFVGNEPFVLLLGDELFYNKKKNNVEQMIEVFDKTGKSVLGLYPVEKNKVSSYGIAQIDGKGKVVKVLEKPNIKDAPSNLSVIGSYIFTPEIFEYLPKPDYSKDVEEAIFTDNYMEFAKKHGLTSCILKGNRYDTGSKMGFLKANIEFGLRDKELSDDLKKYLKKIVKKL